LLATSSSLPLALPRMAQQNNRNSPHLSVSVSAHLHNGSAPSSPSMSSAQQQGGQSRGQPASYPSPTSYPSPSLSSAQYNYPPPNNQQVSEPYRASPTGSNVSLPSMRSLDPLSQAQQHHSMGSNLPPPVAQMGAPYYHNQGQTLPHPSHQYPNVTSDPTGGNMRYALPVTTDSRVMSGGRHKKVSFCFGVIPTSLAIC
jgi:white-opaque regulator 2